MSHLAASHLAFAVPVPVASPAGNLVEPLARDGETFDVRLVTYVEGVPLDATPYRSAKALRATGRIAGETTRALADFAHAGLDRTIQWDLRLARPVVEALDHWVRDDARRAQARRLLESAESLLDPLRDALPQQPVHADITDYNVMATRDRAGRMVPTGLIDFGDLIARGASPTSPPPCSRCARRPDARARGRGRGDPRLPRGPAAVGRRDRGGVAAGPRPRRGLRGLRGAAGDPRARQPVRAGVPRRRLGRRRRPGDRRARVAHESLRAGLGLEPSRRARAAAGAAGRDRRERRAARAGRARRRARPVGARRRAAVRRLVGSRRLPCGAGRRGGRHRALGRGTPRARPAGAMGSTGVRAPRRRPVRGRGNAGVGAGGGCGRPRRGRRRGARLRRRRPAPGRHRAVGHSRPALAAGAAVGTVAERRATDPLPAHLHVQAVADPALDAAGLARPGARRRLARALPRPVAAARPRAAAPSTTRPRWSTAATRRSPASRSTTTSDPPRIERGWRHHLSTPTAAPTSTWSTTSPCSGTRHPRVEAGGRTPAARC